MAVVSKNGRKTCHANSRGELNCRVTQFADSALARDLLEYPDRQKARPALGSYVIEYSAHKTLCKGMVFEPSTDPNKPYWHVAPPPTSVSNILSENVDPSGGHSPLVVFSTFDISNTGKPQSVVSFHYGSRRRESSTFLAQRNTVAAESKVEVDAALLRKHTSQVIPHVWGRCIGGFNRKDWDDLDCKIPVKNYMHEGRPFAYDVSVLMLRPFRSGNRTYFLGSERHNKAGDIATVWEPQPSGRAKEICIIRHVANNF